MFKVLKAMLLKMKMLFFKKKILREKKCLQR